MLQEHLNHTHIITLEVVVPIRDDERLRQTKLRVEDILAQSLPTAVIRVLDLECANLTLEDLLREQK